MSKKSEESIIISKLGLSEVVTTLVIILISLVAIGVVWVVVQNIIQSGSEEVELGQFTLDLQIKSVQIEADNVTVVVVKRNPGQGEFVGMNFIFSDGQNSEIIRQNTTLKELDTKIFTFTLTNINVVDLKTVSVAPIYMLDSGKETPGNLADSFDISANKSLGTEQNVGPGTGAAVGNFERLGFIGTGTFSASVSSNPGIYPQFKSAVVDPLDVYIGDNQTFTVVVYSPYGIANVTTTTQLDTQTLNLPLQKVSGGETEDQTWSATWIAYDTHIETYRTTIIAMDNIGNQNSVALTWTDACTDEIVPGSAESTINTNCTINDMRGTDNGKLIIPDGKAVTLGSGAIIVYNSSITKTGTGKIVDAGGQIKKGYLYYFGSGTTATNATPVFGVTVSPPGGFIRVSAATSITSCTASTSLKYCPASCSDTDGGNAPLTLGTATSWSGTCTNSACTGSLQETDTCLDSTKLNERYCSGNTILTDTVDCVAVYGVSCVSGICNFA